MSREQDGDMTTKSVRRYTFLLVCILISDDGAHLLGANMRSLSNRLEGKHPLSMLAL
jgi:hypothetical protein